MKQAIFKSITTAIAITTGVGISSTAEAASLTLSGITFTEATSNVTLTDGKNEYILRSVEENPFTCGFGNGEESSKCRILFPDFQDIKRLDGGSLGYKTFTLFQEVTAPEIAIKIQGLSKYDTYKRAIRNPRSGIFLKLVVTNKTNTHWVAAQHNTERILGTFSPPINQLALAMPIPYCFLKDIPASSCFWEFGKIFESDKFSKVDDTLNTVIFTNPNNNSIAPGETVTFNYAIADWGEGDFYLKQSYTDYSEQAKSVPEPNSIFSLLALCTVGFASLLKRKHR